MRCAFQHYAQRRVLYLSNKNQPPLKNTSKTWNKLEKKDIAIYTWIYRNSADQYIYITRNRIDRNTSTIGAHEN